MRKEAVLVHTLAITLGRLRENIRNLIRNIQEIESNVGNPENEAVMPTTKPQLSTPMNLQWSEFIPFRR